MPTVTLKGKIFDARHFNYHKGTCWCQPMSIMAGSPKGISFPPSTRWPTSSSPKEFETKAGMRLPLSAIPDGVYRTKFMGPLLGNERVRHSHLSGLDQTRHGRMGRRVGSAHGWRTIPPLSNPKISCRLHK